MEKVKTRIAPSPTGKMHIGNARTALINYIVAKQNGGVFLLRIEDTDRERSKKEYEEDILENLEWLGIRWDEFYRQSERVSLYRRYLEKLLKEGHAFYCPHNSEETKGSIHFCEFRSKGVGESKGIIRFKTPRDSKVQFKDIIRGEVQFDTNEIGDFSIAKGLDEPLFNFAVVIDDYEMQISHVIRGEDHLSNTPKHVLLQKVLGFAIPTYAHFPIILGPDKTKLSKRHGAVSVSEFRRNGYIAEALINMMAFLGWNPGDDREFFSLEELIKEFSLERVKKGGAIFNRQRLDFLNHHYLKTLSLEKIVAYAKPFFDAHYGKLPSEERLQSLVALGRQRAKTLEDIAREVDYAFTLPEYNRDLLLWKKQSANEAREALGKSLQIIEKIFVKEYNERTIEEQLLLSIGQGPDKGEMLWPLRVALSGKRVSPGPFAIASLLGKEETIKRLHHAIAKISS